MKPDVSKDLDCSAVRFLEDVFFVLSLLFPNLSQSRRLNLFKSCFTHYLELPLIIVERLIKTSKTFRFCKPLVMN